MIGEKIGSFLGGAAQKALGTIFGMGEYTETLGNELGIPGEDIAHNEEPGVNSLVRPVSNDIVARMHTDSEGRVRITRREFVSPVMIENGPTFQEILVEPSKAGSFPWLSAIATSWQQYQILGLAYEYVPTSGAAVSDDSGALGQVVMAFKYDVTEAQQAYPTQSLEGMLNQSGAVSTSPAAPSTCYLECDPEMTNQFTRYVRRPASAQGSSSEQNFEAAKLMVFSSGAQNPTDKQAGQLWVTYDIVLLHPTTLPPPTLLSQVTSDPVFQKFQPIWEKLRALSDHEGPYTQDEYIARASMLQVLRSQLLSSELVEARAMWQAIESATRCVAENGSTDQPLKDMIHQSPFYKVVERINPPTPSPALPMERWEAVSNR